MIHVRKEGAERPDLSEFRPARFQGRPAFERSDFRPGNIDDASWFSYSLIFERDGAWFTLHFSVGREIRALPEGVRSHFETFRIERRTTPVAGALRESDE